MRTLGIDYGRKKIGLAISEIGLAEPLRVIRYADIKILCEQIKKIVEEEKIDNIIVGVSEGQMAKETKEFLKTIRYTLNPIPCETFDETLTSQDAQRLSQEAEIPRKKRREMEDAYAASLMLQNYLDIRS